MDDDILHLGLLDDEAIVLDTSALALALLDHPQVDVGPHVTLLTGIAERIAALADNAPDGSAIEARLLAQVIAGEYDFQGDRDTYDDPVNADLIRVIERRRGLPVSLAILYVAAARRLGWSAAALNTPGHVLVQIGAETDPLLIDPFNGGRVVEPAQLGLLLSQRLGADAVPAAEHVQPMTNRAVLVRLLLNQATRAERGGDHARARTLFERMTVIAPANGHGWWERARLELVDRDVGGARKSLSAMLEMTREPALRARISAALEALGDASRH